MEKDTHMVSENIHPTPAFLRTLFFAAGIVATIAYRITPFLTPVWVKVAWYLGTVGFIVYFGHRASVEAKRAKLVKEYGLIRAVEASDLQGEQKTVVSYLMKTSVTSKARFNSIFIM